MFLLTYDLWRGDVWGNKRVQVQMSAGLNAVTQEKWPATYTVNTA